MNSHYCRHCKSMHDAMKVCGCHESIKDEENRLAIIRSICKPENRGMKDGQSCFMIERRDHPELKPYAWLHYDYHSVNEWLWTQDPNVALHFADMASCDQIANEMPDDWDVTITRHSWMDHSNGRES